MHLMWKEYRFEISGFAVVVSTEGIELARLPLLPACAGEDFVAGEWSEIAGDHFQADVSGLGSIHLAIREGYPCYWVETERKHFERLTYFPQSRPTQSGWHSFLSDELDRYWSLDENADVPLSSAYIAMHVDGQDGDGMTDPGDKPPTWIWNIPPRALAIETPRGWMGISIPGPLSVGVTRLTMQRGVFNIHMEELRPTALEWGAPRFYLVPGLADPYDALDSHREISDACGLTRRTPPHQPAWWSYPIFKCADEVLRVNDRSWTIRDENGNLTTRLTTENWLGWIDHVENYTGRKDRWNLMVDQLFFSGYGSRETFAVLGGNSGFRETIDTLRERDMHVGLYVHLCMLDPTATDFPKLHPEAICRPKEPTTRVVHGVTVGSDDLCYVDWTHPLGREYMLGLIEWLISDKPGCLNADYLLINNNTSVDPRKFEFHDPDWGTGDLMTMKITKLIYEHCKKIKPDCYVRRQSPGDPYMQPYCDQAALCEEWNGQTTAWYRRAHIATRVLDNVIFHTDAWFVTLTKLTEYYFALSVFGQPEIESVRHAIHPYVQWREMREKDYHRIRAGIAVYENAPLRMEDKCRVNYKGLEQPELWRKHGTGPLKGWYAALALHKRCFVTYSESEARVGASQERHVTVPLPPGAHVLAVEAVPHEGQAYAYDYENTCQDGEPALGLWVPDSGESIMYIRLRYNREAA